MMEDFIDSNMWKNRGSSVIFDKIMLGPLLNQGALVSLRTALGWLSRWPVDLASANPHAAPGCRTVLIAGLDTVLEVVPPDQAVALVREDVRRIVREFQDRWPEYGLVFGLNTPGARMWEDPASEQVYFVTRDKQRICLSTELWNGSSVTDMGRLLRTDQQARQQVCGGYYAPRS